ncbi:MAG: DNA polymerase III subunit chi [Methylophaga sp.]|nr:MAG: DNA polymerase III subunit chi [Methylophaga sp.]
MTRISFYILKGTEAASRQEFACRLAEKAYKLGHHVYIHTQSADESELINQALWSFRPDSFVPHQIHQGDDQNEPVLIGHDAAPPRLMDLLINLNPSQPLFFSQFERLAELIDDREEIKIEGRKRFQFYKERGYELETHRL